MENCVICQESLFISPLEVRAEKAREYAKQKLDFAKATTGTMFGCRQRRPYGGKYTADYSSWKSNPEILNQRRFNITSSVNFPCIQGISTGFIPELVVAQECGHLSHFTCLETRNRTFRPIDRASRHYDPIECPVCGKAITLTRVRTIDFAAHEGFTDKFSKDIQYLEMMNKELEEQFQVVEDKYESTEKALNDLLPIVNDLENRLETFESETYRQTLVNNTKLAIAENTKKLKIMEHHNIALAKTLLSMLKNHAPNVIAALEILPAELIPILNSLKHFNDDILKKFVDIIVPKPPGMALDKSTLTAEILSEASRTSLEEHLNKFQQEIKNQNRSKSPSPKPSEDIPLPSNADQEEEEESPTKVQNDDVETTSFKSPKVSSEKLKIKKVPLKKTARKNNKNKLRRVHLRPDKPNQVQQNDKKLLIMGDLLENVEESAFRMNSCTQTDHLNSSSLTIGNDTQSNDIVSNAATESTLKFHDMSTETESISNLTNNEEDEKEESTICDDNHANDVLSKLRLLFAKKLANSNGASYNAVNRVKTQKAPTLSKKSDSASPILVTTQDLSYYNLTGAERAPLPISPKMPEEKFRKYDHEESFSPQTKLIENMKTTDIARRKTNAPFDSCKASREGPFIYENKLLRKNSQIFTIPKYNTKEETVTREYCGSENQSEKIATRKASRTENKEITITKNFEKELEDESDYIVNKGLNIEVNVKQKQDENLNEVYTKKSKIRSQCHAQWPTNFEETNSVQYTLENVTTSNIPISKQMREVSKEVPVENNFPFGNMNVSRCTPDQMTRREDIDSKNPKQSPVVNQDMVQVEEIVSVNLNNNKCFELGSNDKDVLNINEISNIVSPVIVPPPPPLIELKMNLLEKRVDCTGSLETVKKNSFVSVPSEGELFFDKNNNPVLEIVNNNNNTSHVETKPDFPQTVYSSCPVSSKINEATDEFLKANKNIITNYFSKASKEYQKIQQQNVIEQKTETHYPNSTQGEENSTSLPQRVDCGNSNINNITLKDEASTFFNVNQESVRPGTSEFVPKENSSELLNFKSTDLQQPKAISVTPMENQESKPKSNANHPSIIPIIINVPTNSFQQQQQSFIQDTSQIFTNSNSSNSVQSENCFPKKSAKQKRSHIMPVYLIKHRDLLSRASSNDSSIADFTDEVDDRKLVAKFIKDHFKKEAMGMVQKQLKREKPKEDSNTPKSEELSRAPQKIPNNFRFVPFPKVMQLGNDRNPQQFIMEQTNPHVNIPYPQHHQDTRRLIQNSINNPQFAQNREEFRSRVSEQQNYYQDNIGLSNPRSPQMIQIIPERNIGYDPYSSIPSQPQHNQQPQLFQINQHHQLQNIRQQQQQQQQQSQLLHNNHIQLVENFSSNASSNQQFMSAPQPYYLNVPFQSQMMQANNSPPPSKEESLDLQNICRWLSPPPSPSTWYENQFGHDSGSVDESGQINYYEDALPQGFGTQSFQEGS